RELNSHDGSTLGSFPQTYSHRRNLSRPMSLCGAKPGHSGSPSASALSTRGQRVTARQRRVDGEIPLASGAVPYRKANLLNPILSWITALGPTGTRAGFGRSSFRNTILSRQTFRKKSSKTRIVSFSPGHRRYPKPNGA